MTPIPLLAALIILKLKEIFISNKNMIPIDEDCNAESSIIKTKIIDEMTESDSTQKLVNGDANENIVA